jgi:flagellar basal-body rod protein FlgF
LASVLLTIHHEHVNIGLYQSAAALNAIQNWQQAAAQNMTASQNAGYRKRVVSFSAANLGSWQLPASNTDFSGDTVNAQFPVSSNSISFLTGTITPTGSELDIALQGNGFFSLLKPDGSTAYTRNGEFRLDATRTIIDSNGNKLLSSAGAPITLAEGAGKVTIGPDGTIAQGDTALGKVGVLSFANNADLIPISGGLFIPINNARPSTVVSPNIMQGFVEGSNISPMLEMVDMVTISRTYEANQKVITSADQQMQKTLDALG